MGIYETIANADFAMFLLGAFGVSFYVMIHKAIMKCNSKVFSIISVVLTYIFIAWIKSNRN